MYVKIIKGLSLKKINNTIILLMHIVTFQCLKTVPELRQALTRFQGKCATRRNTLKISFLMSGSVSLGGGTDAESLTASLRDLYSTMDKGTTIPPIIMLQVLKVNSKQPLKYRDISPRFSTTPSPGLPSAAKVAATSSRMPTSAGWRSSGCSRCT